MIYLGRLHPIKGIENLLTACSMLNGNLGRSASLTIAGSGDKGYAQMLNARIEELGLADRVRMIGNVEDDARRKLFADADILVAPSFTENFGMVVAEALAHEVPVIASKGTPWSRVGEKNAGLWVDNSPESLAVAIERMSRMPLREMGARGREWMKEGFSSAVVAERMLEAYRGLVTGYRGQGAADHRPPTNH